MTVDRQRTRRQLLASLGSATAVGLAGCLTGDGGDGSDDGDGGTDAGDADGGDDETDADGGNGSNDGNGTSSDPLGPTAWPMRNFDAGQTGSRSDVTPPSGSLEVEWSIAKSVDRHPGDRYSPIHVGSGHVVTALPDGQVVAVDAETGDEAWTYDVGERASTGGGIAFFDGTVYVSSQEYGADFPLYAIDVETGEVDWQTAAGQPFDPVVYDGTIFGVEREGLLALDVSDGTTVWEESSINGTLSVAVADGTLYSYSTDGDDSRIAAYDAASGDSQWETDAFYGGGTASGQHLSVADGTVYATNQRGTVFAFETGSGSKQWESNPYTENETGATDTMPREAPVVGDDHVFVGGYNVHALSKSDGSETWSTGTVNGTRDYMIHVDGELLSLQRPGLQAFDASDGTKTWNVTLPFDREGCLGDVAVTDGRIYVSEDRCVGEDPTLWAVGVPQSDSGSSE